MYAPVECCQQRVGRQPVLLKGCDVCGVVDRQRAAASRVFRVSALYDKVQLSRF